LFITFGIKSKNLKIRESFSDECADESQTK